MAIPTYLGAVAKALDKVSVVSAKHSSRRHFSTVSRASRAHPTPCRAAARRDTSGVRVSLSNLNHKPRLPFAVSKRKALMIKIKHFDRACIARHTITKSRHAHAMYVESCYCSNTSSSSSSLYHAPMSKSSSAAFARNLCACKDRQTDRHSMSMCYQTHAPPRFLHSHTPKSQGTAAVSQHLWLS